MPLQGRDGLRLVHQTMVGRNGFAESGVAKSLGGWMYPFEPAGVQ
jgi:hypothetical protein